jgi:hypothetical protein
MRILYSNSFDSNLKALLLFAFVFILLAGCKKKEEEVEVLSFIEYKIDGQFYHFEDDKLPGILSSNASSSYYLMGMAEGDISGPKATTHIELKLSQTSISTTIYDQSNSSAIVSFLHSNTLGNTKQKYYKVDQVDTPGNWQISFSKLGNPNEFSEGTFYIEGISLFNANDSLLSSNTVVTEGKFKVKMN